MIAEGVQELEKYVEVGVAIRFKALFIDLPPTPRFLLQCHGVEPITLNFENNGFIGDDGGIRIITSMAVKLSGGRWNACVVSEGLCYGQVITFNVMPKIRTMFQRNECRVGRTSTIRIQNVPMESRVHIRIDNRDVRVGFGQTDRDFKVTPRRSGEKRVRVFIDGVPASSNPAHIYAKRRRDSSHSDRDTSGTAVGDED